MGDVVELAGARRSRPRRRSPAEASETGTIALFTGVRIERAGDAETRPEGEPGNRPTSPRRRRRRTSR